MGDEQIFEGIITSSINSLERTKSQYSLGIISRDEYVDKVISESYTLCQSACSIKEGKFLPLQFTIQ